jgi:C4-dicarboxylate-specific signal transduction histidine kinase
MMQVPTHHKSRLTAGLAAGVIGLCALAAAIVVIAGGIAFRYGAERAFERGRIDAERYTTQLTTEFHRFDYLSNLLVEHPAVINVLNETGRKDYVDAANRYLESVSGAAGTSNLYLLDKTGKVIATSNWNQPTSFFGIDFSYRPYFQNAMTKGEDRFYGIGTVSGTPGYFFAVALPRDKTTLGVGVVKVNLEDIGIYRSASIKDILIVDENGVVVLASRPEFKYRAMMPIPGELLTTIRATRQYDKAPLTSIDIATEDVFDGGSIVSLPEDASGESRSRFLAQEIRLEGSSWKIVVLSDLSEVVSLQRWTQLITALFATTIGFLILFLMQRRRTIQAQLAMKDFLARANIELEAQVTERTQALVEANQQLREAQEVLVHSAKLAAIGQLAAGITHELHQPVAAIRMLSENAGVLIRRSQSGVASDNLQAILDLTGRMNKIIGRLKQFSRKSRSELQAVSIVDSINNSRQILASKVQATRVKIDFRWPDQQMQVFADPIRIEQIFINLISNAIDAVASVDRPAIEIVAWQDEDSIFVSAADNGAGLSDDALAHLFEPFFTTKEAGAGLGLGLAISIGIVREFGGTLSASNLDRGGAEFIVKLPLLVRSREMIEV